jgi:hypothetical protein
MKQIRFAGIAFIMIAVGLSSLVLPVSPAAGSSLSVQAQDSKRAGSFTEDIMLAKFEGRVTEYARLRERLEDKLPKLPKDSTPEKIKAHKTAFQEMVRAARAGAKQGDLFTPDIADYLRKTIRNEFKGERLEALRQEILAAETQGVPLRVNYEYPETKELTQIPPTLLLKLPRIRKQVRYRFVGRHLLLVDRENDLIVDYMLDALPWEGRGPRRRIDHETHCQLSSDGRPVNLQWLHRG